MEGQEKSEMSLGEEEQFMDVLLESLLVLPEEMDTTVNTSGIMKRGNEEEDWLDDSIFKERNFEDWVEGELRYMEVTMEVEPG